MTITHPPERHPGMQAAIAEMQTLIREHHPTATFRVSRGEAPGSVFLTATVDVDDTDDVFDLVVDRLLDLQVEEGVPLQVIPVRTPERIAAILAARRTQESAALPL